MDTSRYRAQELAEAAYAAGEAFGPAAEEAKVPTRNLGLRVLVFAIVAGTILASLLYVLRP